ncbi:hypothetical protein [Spiroplasma endosymbiont of Panzeria rudis]|uniref:hypothetical protein n=1 Tax=Spiroplasma endosymbiont of Panzeria rudis TaxID=3066301 RepID=UPI0030D0FCF7
MPNFKRLNSNVSSSSELEINDNEKVKKSSGIPSPKKIANNVKKQFKKNMPIIGPVAVGRGLLLTGVPVIGALAATASTAVVASIADRKLETNKAKKESKQKNEIFKEEQMECFKSKLASQKAQYDYERKTFEVGLVEKEVENKKLKIELKMLDDHLEKLNNKCNREPLSELNPNINQFNNKIVLGANSLETNINNSDKTTLRPSLG